MSRGAPNETWAIKDCKRALAEFLASKKPLECFCSAEAADFIISKVKEIPYYWKVYPTNRALQMLLRKFRRGSLQGQRLSNGRYLFWN